MFLNICAKFGLYCSALLTPMPRLITIKSNSMYVFLVLAAEKDIILVNNQLAKPSITITWTEIADNYTLYYKQTKAIHGSKSTSESVVKFQNNTNSLQLGKLYKVYLELIL